MNPIIIIGGVVLLLGFIGAGAFFLRGGGGGADKATQDRLDRFVGDFETATSVQPIGDDDEGETAVAKFTQNIDEAIETRGFAQKISAEMAKANLSITVAEYIIAVVVTIVLTATLAFFIYDQNLVMALVGGVVGFFLPRFYVNQRKSKRLKLFDGQLGDTIQLMANGLRSGYSLLMSMESVGQEMPDPISEEFERVVREISLGVPNDRAMNNLHRRIPSDDLELMITAINVQHEVGGNLSEILEIIGFVIRERVRIAGEIKTLTAQGMMGGYIISGLPIALGLMLFAMNQEYIGRMVFDNETQPCGWLMLGGGFLLIGMGFMAIMKIVKIEI
jgi:tight adherence protein B